MARGRKNTPVEGQLDIFDALMDIDADEHELTPGEDTTNADNEHHSGVRPEVRPEAIQQDSEPGDLFSQLAEPAPRDPAEHSGRYGAGAGDERPDENHRTAPNTSRPGQGTGLEPDRGGDVSSRSGRDRNTPGSLTPESIPAAETAQQPAAPSMAVAEPFYLSQADQYAPSGAKTRYKANIEAIRTVRQLEAEQRPATRTEQETLAAWSSWGAVPDVFDSSKDNWVSEYAELREILTDEEYDAARRTTLNAHYTDPRLVTAMWETMSDLGLESGRVLEPGTGSGNYIGTAPQSMNMVGVELDPLTAAIAGHLYPQADVRSESFADTTVRQGEYDAAIGNVPFGDRHLPDPTWNPDARFSMHNHFMRKAIGGLHDGGVMAVITSQYSMDSQNPAFRAEVSKEADFLGAVRLPSGTHRRTAGTDVVTDVLLFRKRMAGEEPTPETRQWVKTSAIDVDDNGITRTPRTNDYFIAHPENVLGEYSIGGQFHNSLQVTSNDLAAVPSQLRERLAFLAADAQAKGRGYVPLSEEEQAVQAEAIQAQTELTIGTIVFDDGEFKQVSPQQTFEPYDIPKTRHAEAKSLLDLRDRMFAVIQEQAGTTADSDQSITLRDTARDAWQKHVDRYGPINRFTTSWVDRKVENKDTGEKEIARVEKRHFPTVNKALAPDPMWSLVVAAENFNESTQTAQPAHILTRRTVSTKRPLLGADTAEEALALVLDHTGRTDLDQIAARLGISPEETRDQLGTLVFDDPHSDEIITRAEYLSGNVREKLAEARAKAEADPNGGWITNVEALEAVIPEDVPISDIEAQIGAVWIPASVHEQFLEEITGDDNARVVNHGGGYWDVKGSRDGRAGYLATDQWGTDRRPAHDLFDSLVNSREVKVQDKDAEGKPYLNDIETQSAKDKADEIQERFSEWVWEDPDRANDLSQRYNQQFNSLVARDYTAEGQRLSLPGLAADFTPHEHQRTAVARIVSEQGVGLFHQVGAGKTAVMVMGAMELKRRGLVNKPAVIVPGHMLEQFTREWKQMYPQAQLLSAGADDMKVVNGDASARRAFVARATTGDWDGIIMTHSAFEKLDVSDATLTAYSNQQIADLRETLESMSNDPDNEFKSTVKQIENKIAKEEDRLKKVLDGRDVAGLTLEETGIDHTAIDEAHLFKNLRTFSRINGANIDGSGRASDLDMKLDCLRRTYGNRVVTMATGTPIANSITEAHVMMRYIRPDLLRETGVERFDDWAKTFGQTVSRFERNAAGELVTKDRFSKFKNVPEMLGVWQQFADVKMTKDLPYLKIPDLVLNEDGERIPKNEVITRSNVLATYMDELGDRLDKLAESGGRPGKGEDNHLTVYSDGRKAALDPRLVGRDPGGEYLKVNKVAKTVAEMWRENRENEYPISGAHEHRDIMSEDRGALQLVFCDVSTPNPDKWNFYDQLKSELGTSYGMDRDRIRFIHEAKNDEQKAALFKEAREGKIDVLVGSTSKMGTGANIQLRAKALHHVDCPWRPDEVTQREGRILRQGNANDEVNILRYATDNSFDSTAWGTIARKAGPINQIMQGRIDVREVDDPGDLEVQSQALMGKISGNPLVAEKVELEAEVGTLERRQRSFTRQEQATQHKFNMAKNSQLFATEALPEAQTVMDKTRQSENFTASVNGRSYDKRSEAQKALIADVVDIAGRGRTQLYTLMAEQHQGVMELNGHDVGWSVGGGPARNAAVKFDLDGSDLDGTWVSYSWNDLVTSEAAANVIVSLENRVKNLPTLHSDLEQRLQDSSTEMEALAPKLGAQFPQADELAEAKAKLNVVNAKLDLSEASASTVPAPSGGGTAIDEQTQEVLNRVRANRGSAEATQDSEATDTRPASDQPWRQPTQTESSQDRTRE